MKRRTLAVCCVSLLGLFGCTREQRTGEQRGAAETGRRAGYQQERDQFAREMERRLNDLEQRISRMRSQNDNRKQVNQARWQEVQEEIAGLRQEVSGLRTISQENWWQKTTEWFDRSADELENRIAGRSGVETDGSQRTATGEETGGPISRQEYEHRRDQYVSRMQSRIDGLERTLEQARQRSRSAGAEDRRKWQDIENELNDLRAAVSDPKDSSYDQWWRQTRGRVERDWNRVERSAGEL